MMSKVAEARERFNQLWERMHRYARKAFRFIRCWDEREERIQEAIAFAWKTYRRAVVQGWKTAAEPWPHVLYGIRKARAGRSVIDRKSSLSLGYPFAPTSRQVHQHSLSHRGPDGEQPTFLACLADRRASDQFDALAVRLDFRSWVETLTARERKLLAVVEETGSMRAAARAVGLCPGYARKLRNLICSMWCEHYEQAMTPHDMRHD